MAMALSAVLSVAAFALVPTDWAASGPLAGTWTSVDTDGSNQTLDIKGSGVHVYSMFYFDDAASACGGDPAQLTGRGSLDGDVLIMAGVLTCLPGGNFVWEQIYVGFAYDSSDDTLTDDFGIVWHRAS